MRCLQGDLADCFYIVESGQVRITMKRSRVGCKNDFSKKKAFVCMSYMILSLPFLKQTKNEQEEEEVDIAMCSRGQYFGELALVTNKPRAASAYAVGSVKCLGRCPAILRSFRTSGMLMWELAAKTQYMTFPFLFFFQVMDVKAFERLLGPCMDIMKRNIANYEEQLKSLFGSSTEIEQQSS